MKPRADADYREQVCLNCFWLKQKLGPEGRPGPYYCETLERELGPSVLGRRACTSFLNWGWGEDFPAVDADWPSL